VAGNEPGEIQISPGSYPALTFKKISMEVDLKIIQRFLDGDQKEGDRELILDWFSDLGVEADLRKKYARYWEALTNNQDLTDYDAEKVLGLVHHRITLRESRRKSKNRALKRVMTIVTRAAAVLFIPVTIFLYTQRDQTLQMNSRLTYSEIYSPLGTRTRFYLPDGSHGWLNNGSSITFPTAFTGKTREVILKGEAFFEVVSNKKKPFHVVGPHISVTAFGTSFNVQAYQDDPVTTVTLASGSVRVGALINSEIKMERLLKPDQMYTYDRNASTLEVREVNADYISSWKEGKLIFADNPLKEVVKTLNRRYNADILIKDEILESYVYMATFEDETLDEVLKLLALTAPIEVKDRGREINDNHTFSKRRIELYLKSR
jgi:transmembrane sensor